MASEDPIAKYQDALSALDAAERAAQTVVGIVIDVGNKLARNWKRVTVANADPPIPFPVGAVTDSVNASTWPTAQELGQAMAAWHTARHEARNAWSAIPAERRVGIQGPPD